MINSLQFLLAAFCNMFCHFFSTWLKKHDAEIMQSLSSSSIMYNEQWAALSFIGTYLCFCQLNNLIQLNNKKKSTDVCKK